jgi:hypothetical protein
MNEAGLSREAYRPEYPDCDDFSLLMAYVLTKLLSVYAYGNAPKVRQYSFMRDNGKRHRLVAVFTRDEGIVFIENYPVMDGNHTQNGMIRELSVSEKQNGVLI